MGVRLPHLIHADESGDLGWSFDKPYGNGGSSRYLVIFALCVDDGKIHRVDRLVKDLYKGSRWDPQREKKWIEMSEKSRDHFLRQAVQLREAHPDIGYHAIVVSKEHVQSHMRADANKLYNYMVKLLLLGEMAKHQHVSFIPDSRSVKVASGNSQHDYLQTELWYEKRVNTVLQTLPTDSRHCKPLQFADMMAGAVGSNFEFKKAQYLATIGRHLSLKRLFFK